MNGLTVFNFIFFFELRDFIFVFFCFLFMATTGSFPSKQLDLIVQSIIYYLQTKEAVKLIITNKEIHDGACRRDQHTKSILFGFGFMPIVQQNLKGNLPAS